MKISLVSLIILLFGCSFLKKCAQHKPLLGDWTSNPHFFCTFILWAPKELFLCQPSSYSSRDILPLWGKLHRQVHMHLRHLAFAIAYTNLRRGEKKLAHFFEFQQLEGWLFAGSKWILIRFRVVLLQVVVVKNARFFVNQVMAPRMETPPR